MTKSSIMWRGQDVHDHEAWIADKGMTSRYTPQDVLFEYSSMVSVTTQSRVMNQPLPANVMRIEEDLALDFFPSNQLGLFRNNRKLELECSRVETPVQETFLSAVETVSRRRRLVAGASRP